MGGESEHAQHLLSYLILIVAFSIAIYSPAASTARRTERRGADT
jgi:hypothetical protein